MTMFRNRASATREVFHGCIHKTIKMHLVEHPILQRKCLIILFKYEHEYGR